MKMKKYLFCICLLLGLAACKDDEAGFDNPEQREAFLRQTAFGVWQGGGALLLFQPDRHQLTYTGDGKIWRVQTDDQRQYISCELSEGVVGGRHPDARIKVRGIEGITEGSSQALVLKTETGKCWLWLPEQGIGLFMQLKIK